MARIAGVDIPRNKRVEIALTYIYGIGKPTSQKILKEAGVNFDTRVKDLTEEEVKTAMGLSTVNDTFLSSVVLKVITNFLFNSIIKSS